MKPRDEGQASVEQEQYIISHSILGIALTERQVRSLNITVLILALACSYNMYWVHLDYQANKEYRMSYKLPIFIYLDDLATAFTYNHYIVIQRQWYSLYDADKPAIWHIWLTFTCICWLCHFLCVWLLVKITSLKELEHDRIERKES